MGTALLDVSDSVPPQTRCLEVDAWYISFRRSRSCVAFIAAEGYQSADRDTCVALGVGMGLLPKTTQYYVLYRTWLILM